MLPPKGLTATIIFEAQSLNYDEGYGSNLSVLKKFHRGSGEVFSYSSRQSIRYSIFSQGVREFGWRPSDVVEAGSRDNKVTQLTSSIIESEESDLFGYMQTNVVIGKDDKSGKGKEATLTRTTPVRILPAIALEPFSSDMEMLTNKYQADKIQSQPNIANMENQRTLFRYTVCIDLHRVGSEQDRIGTKVSLNKSDARNDKDFGTFESKLRSLDIGLEKKRERVSQFVDIIGRLYRDIRGRREDLKPLFIIGGIYSTFNPFFENIVTLEWDKNKKPRVNTRPLLQILNGTYTSRDSSGNEIQKSVKEDTFLGIRDGFFANDLSDFQSFWEQNQQKEHVGSPEFLISELKKRVAEYYK
jgi:CRISPR-associated protein Cst2